MANKHVRGNMGTLATATASWDVGTAEALRAENAFLRQLISDLKSESDAYRRGVEEERAAVVVFLERHVRGDTGDICARLIGDGFHREVQPK